VGEQIERAVDRQQVVSAGMPDQWSGLHRLGRASMGPAGDIAPL